MPGISFATSDDGRRFGAARPAAHVGHLDYPRPRAHGGGPAGRRSSSGRTSTAVRRRILLRYSFDGGRTLSPVQTLSTAIKACEPDIAVAPEGGFVVAWHEEQFPSLKTVVQPLRVSP